MRPRERADTRKGSRGGHVHHCPAQESTHPHNQAAATGSRGVFNRSCTGGEAARLIKQLNHCFKWLNPHPCLGGARVYHSYCGLMQQK